MKDNHGLDDVLRGLCCTSVVKAESPWQLGFGGGKAILSLECPWRLIVGGSIAYGYEDHEQKFGLPDPIDGVKETEKLLSNSPITIVEIRCGTGDLALTFENGVKLEAFNSSSGYEGWTLSGGLGFLVVAQGGGNISAPRGRYVGLRTARAGNGGIGYAAQCRFDRCGSKRLEIPRVLIWS